MAAIRGKNTKPELIVRKGLWSRGFRYRLNHRRLPGHPDLVLRKYRTCIFVNGCFWHGHKVDMRFLDYARNDKEGDRRDDKEPQNSDCCKIPKTNRDFWVNKILRNQERDQQNYQILQDNGWQVIVLWECQLKANLLEDTMRQVEVALQDNYLRTFSHKTKTYILVDEENLPMAAEDTIEYN